MADADRSLNPEFILLLSGVVQGLVVAGLVIILFAADLAVGVPFRRASMMLDIALLCSAALLGVLSWFTLREQ